MRNPLKWLSERFYYWWTFTDTGKGYIKYKDRNKDFEEFVAELKPDVVIAPQDDGSYICCEEKFYSAHELYMHRRFDHKS